MATNFDGLNLNRLVVFVAVVEAGSITAAATKLGLGKTIVSSHIQLLEQELGVSLLVRNTRRLGLTDVGEEFFESSRLILQEAREAIAKAGRRAAMPTGTLRVSAPVDFSCAVLSSLLIDLQQRYPDLRIELNSEDRIVDLIGEGYDAAIRLSDLPDSNLQAVHIGDFRLWLMASPVFLARHPPIRDIESLGTLPYIALSVIPNSSCWLFETPDQRSQRIEFNASLSASTAYSARAMAVAGGGLTLVPDFAAIEYLKTGQLVHVLPEWSIAPRGIHVVFPFARFRSQKIRVFVDELKRHMQDWVGILHPFQVEPRAKSL